MSLIKCEDCGKEASDKASACIHCWCPIENTEETEEYEEDYVEDCESWYDLSDDRQNELKEEFYSKVRYKSESCVLIFFAGSVLGFFIGIILFFGTGIDGDGGFLTGIITFALCYGYLFAVLANKGNKKLDEHFTSWLNHSKHIHKSKE